MAQLKILFEIIRAIPQIIAVVKQLIDFWLTTRQRLREDKNESNEKRLEEARTEEERQVALEEISKQFGKH